MSATSNLSLWKAVFFILSAAFLIVRPSIEVSADPDLWGHTRFGIDHIQSGVLARQDPYSYTAAGREWINHEWLTEWLFGFFFLHGQGAGLFWLRAGVFLAAMTGIVILYWMRWPHPVFVLMMTAVTAPFFAIFVNVRPQGFTLLLAVVFLLILEAYRRGKRIWISLLPVLMAVWANLHGGFVVGLAIAACGLVSFYFGEPAAKRADGSRKKWLAGVLLLTSAAVLINPYGVKLLNFLFTALRLPRTTITEWKSLAADQLPYYLFFLVVPVTMLVLSRARSRRDQAVLFFLSALGAYYRGRLFVYFVLFSGLLIMETGSVLWNRRMARQDRRLPDGLNSTAAVSAMFVMITVFSVFVCPPDWKRLRPVVRVPTDESDARSLRYPVRAVNFLKSFRLGPNLEVPFNWGEYAIWHLYPDYKVSMDGRYETVYPVLSTKSSTTAVTSAGNDSYAPDERADVVLTESSSREDRQLSRNPLWTQVYRDKAAAVYLPYRKLAFVSVPAFQERAKKIAEQELPGFFP